MPDARAPILVSNDSGNNNNDNDNDSFSSLYAHVPVLVSDDSGNNSDDNGAVGAWVWTLLQNPHQSLTCYPHIFESSGIT